MYSYRTVFLVVALVVGSVTCDIYDDDDREQSYIHERKQEDYADLYIDVETGGGVPINIGQAPNHVALFDNGKYYCDGSIINVNYVLTSGDCAKNAPHNIRIISGTDFWGSIDNTIRKVIEVKRSDKIPNAEFCSDIALMKVDPPFEMDETHNQIDIYSETNFPYGNLARITLYQQTKRGEQYLMMITAPVMRRTECAKIYKEHGFRSIREEHVCTMHQVGIKTSCPSIPGSPLTVTGQLVGVSCARTRPCGSNQMPSVYANVEYYANWIKNNAIDYYDF